MIEVMAVLVILAATALAANMLAPLNATRSLDSAAEARKLVAALRSARQSAITGGTPVQLRFQEQGGLIVNYTLERDSGGGKFVSIMPASSVAPIPVRSTNAPSIIFQPTGAANNSILVAFGNGKQRHEVTVVSGTGMVRYAKK